LTCSAFPYRTGPYTAPEPARDPSGASVSPYLELSAGRGEGVLPRCFTDPG